ncbi:MAG: DUF368 domain-containing protein [Clostridia bacterium]
MESDIKKEYSHKSIKEWLLAIIKGAIIGVGAILPGISGGVLCMLFGVYEPMMAFLAHPLKTFKRYYKFFIPIFVGWAVGFLGLARLVDLLFKNATTPAVCLFIGLIVGTLPALWRSAGKKGRTKLSWVTLAVSAAVSLGLLLYLQYGVKLSVEPTILWWAFCGALWGISLIVPGLSSSAFLIFLGLYQPMTEGIANLNMGVLIPLIVGLILCIALFARVVNRLFEKKYEVMFSIILGVVISSTITIIPFSELALNTNLIIYLGAFAIGVVIAYFMDKLSIKYATEEKIQ